MKKKFKNNTDYSLAHVLYQKLGTDWYAFTEVDGDCFMTRVDAEVVDENRVAKEHQADSRTKRPKAA